MTHANQEEGIVIMGSDGGRADDAPIPVILVVAVGEVERRKEGAKDSWLSLTTSLMRMTIEGECV